MKVPKNFTIDEELIPKIEKEAREKKRSESFIVNEILLNHYSKSARDSARKK